MSLGLNTPTQRVSSQALIVTLITTLFFVSLPWLLRAFHQPTPEAIYRAVPPYSSDWNYLHDQTFNEEGDIDVLFLGPSYLWMNIDTPQIQAALDKHWKRSTTCRSLGYYWSGPDLSANLLAQLLKKRKVKNLVLYSLSDYMVKDHAHQFYTYWHNETEFRKEGRSSEVNASLKAGDVLGAPRKLLSLLRDDLTEHNPQSDRYHPVIKKEHLGALKELRDNQWGQKYEAFTMPTKVLNSDEMIYSKGKDHWFQVSNKALPPYMLYFYKEIGRLCQKWDVHIVMVDFPRYADREKTKVPLIADWSKVFKTNVPVLGIPSSVMYDNVDEETMKKIVFDEDHLNHNGAVWQTHTLLPAFLKVLKP